MAGSRRPQSRRAQQPQINAADASLQRPSCVSKSLSEMLAAGSLKQVFAPKRIEPRVRRTQYYEGEAWKEPEPVPEAKAAPGRAESASFAPKKQEVASIPQIPLNEIRGVLELVQSPGPGHPTEQRGVAFVSGKWQRLAEPGTPSHEAEPVSVCVAFEDSPKICVAASPHRRKSCLSRRSSSCDGRASPTSIKKFSWSPQLCESDDFHQPRISRSGSSGALSVATSIASAQTLPCRQISGSLEEAETRLRRSRTSSSLVDHAKTVCMGGLRQGASRASHLGRGRYASEGHSVPSLLTGAATRSRSKTH